MATTKKPAVHTPLQSTPQAEVPTSQPGQSAPATPSVAAEQQQQSSTLVPAADVKGVDLKAPLKDVRGWSVTGPGKTVIGVVDAIMLDRAEHKPRYLTVTLSENRGRMLLPIGVGTADVSGRTVMLDDVKPEVLKALPMLSQDQITPEFERKVVTAVIGGSDTMYAPTRWYTRPEFDMKNLFSTAAL